MSGTCSKTSLETIAPSDASPKLSARASSCRTPSTVVPLAVSGPRYSLPITVPGRARSAQAKNGVTCS